MAAPPRRAEGGALLCFCEEERGEEERGEEGRGEEGRDGRGQGCFRLHVTDGLRLWSTCFPPARLAALKARCGRSAAEDLAPQFRAAFQRQAVAFTPQGDGASLTLSGGPWPLDFDLSEVPGPEAAPRLQALTLGLAERVCSLERQLAAAEETAASPRKSPGPGGPLPFSPDPDSQRGGPGPGVRRRSPGESLINPGFKSKKPASAQSSWVGSSSCQAGSRQARNGQAWSIRARSSRVGCVQAGSSSSQAWSSQVGSSSGQTRSSWLWNGPEQQMPGPEQPGLEQLAPRLPPPQACLSDMAGNFW